MFLVLVLRILDSASGISAVVPAVCKLLGIFTRLSANVYGRKVRRK